MVLIQDEPIVFRDSKRFPKDPPLLSTCKQIRAEASGIYGKNRLEISLLSFDITKVTNWMRLSPPRVALYEKSEIGLTTFGGNWGVNGPPGGNPWQNLLTWVELYYQRRCRRIVGLPARDNGVEERGLVSEPSTELNWLSRCSTWSKSCSRRVAT